MQLINNILLDSVSTKAQITERLRMNYNFHEEMDSKSQRLLNAIEIGTVLPIHKHNHSAETYILLRGRIIVIFYNKVDGVAMETERIELNPLVGEYGVNIPAGQWHTLEVLESGSVIFEVKDGPYTPLGEDDIIK